MPGDDIGDVSAQAIALANYLGIIMKFRFNDVECMVMPGDDSNKLVDAYRRELKSEEKYKLAIAR
jgi:NTP pyrophosphatase (non-canonical NTP hydrolase)